MLRSNFSGQFPLKFVPAVAQLPFEMNPTTGWN